MARVIISNNGNGYTISGLNFAENKRMMATGKFSLSILDDDDYEFDPPELGIDFLKACDSDRLNEYHRRRNSIKEALQSEASHYCKYCGTSLGAIFEGDCCPHCGYPVK
ncbi:MAG: hypothetical protein J5629_05535 [Muribaculaceae bacterium]|nr:hypothetical protein [Muribaculaceae bacterium]